MQREKCPRCNKAALISHAATPDDGIAAPDDAARDHDRHDDAESDAEIQEIPHADECSAEAMMPALETDAVGVLEREDAAAQGTAARLSVRKSPASSEKRARLDPALEDDVDHTAARSQTHPGTQGSTVGLGGTTVHLASASSRLRVGPHTSEAEPVMLSSEFRPSRE